MRTRDSVKDVQANLGRTRLPAYPGSTQLFGTGVVAPTEWDLGGRMRRASGRFMLYAVSKKKADRVNQLCGKAVNASRGNLWRKR